jgi:hypothetical protein
MKTCQSFGFQRLLANALESPSDVEKAVNAKGEAVDAVRQEAGFKSWLTRIRGQMEDLKQKVAAHREVGEEVHARNAENEHRAKEREFHAKLEERRAKGQWVPAADAPLAAARLRAVQQRPAPVRQAPVVEAPKVARVPPAQIAGIKAAMAEAKQEREAGAKPRPKVTQFKGEAHELEAHAKAEGKRLRAEGFKQIEVDPISVEPDANGKVKGGEVLAHPDGRKVEINVEFNHNTGKGEVEVFHRTPPKAEVVVEVAGVLKNPQKDVVTPAGAMRAADVDRSLISELKSLNIGGGGVSGSYIAKFKDGSRCVYKPDSEGLLTTDPGIRESLDSNIKESRRELVAFAISDAAGFNIVPPVDVVTYADHDPNAQWFNKLLHLNLRGKGGEGGSQAWVNGKSFTRDTPKEGELSTSVFEADAQKDHPDIHRLAALDCLVLNTDRHAANFMKGNTDGRYYAVDNGLILPSAKGAGRDSFKSAPLRELAGHKIPSEVKAEIQRLTPEHLRKAMVASGFPEADIKAIVARHEYIKTLEVWPTIYSIEEALLRVSKRGAA